MGLELSGGKGGWEGAGLWEILMRLLAAVPGAAHPRMSLQRKGSSLRAETGDTRGCMENHCWEPVFRDVSTEEAECGGWILKM